MLTKLIQDLCHSKGQYNGLRILSGKLEFGLCKELPALLCVLQLTQHEGYKKLEFIPENNLSAWNQENVVAVE